MVTLTVLCSVAMATAAFQGPLKSPVVHADRSVTFNLRAPNAKAVTVSIEGNPGLTLAQNSQGVWTGTSKPLVPDIYGYSFSVDGQTVLDPLNSETKPNLIWPSNMLTVPGTPPELWEVQDVPHGTVHHHFYKSKVVGDQRDFYVYTPPQYEMAKGKLPVLYLLHGYSDTAVGWTAVGKAHVILDNLIAQGKAKPMIVVMTLGYGVPNFATPANDSWGKPGLVKKSFDNYRSALLTEVIPAVERQYRASAKWEDRAIAGLSMGGAESLYVGLSNLKTFSAIGAFSSGGFPAEKPEEILPDLKVADANRLKQFYIVCGTADGLIGFHRGFTGWLKERGIRHQSKETGGGHEWMRWRRNLAEFTSMIFK